jgi:uncharacterized protein YciW
VNATAQEAAAASIRDLDARIEHADNHAKRLRAMRREVRLKLHDAGWSWRALGRLSGHSHFAVRKDADYAD